MTTRRAIESIAIVDSHHHLWDLSRFAYPWLTTKRRPRRFGDYESICRTYLVPDLLADTRPCRVVASVHIQAETGEEPLAETRWLAEQRRSTGYPAKLIAKSDLTAPQVERDLDAHLAAGPVAGVREPVHWAEDPRYGGHSASDRVAQLANAGAAGLRALARRGLLLEVVNYFTQVPALVALLRAHPDLRVIIDHCGMPLHLDPWPVPFADAEAGWRDSVRQLARLPNVHMKISGLWMAGRALSLDDVRPIVAHILDCFGVARCLVGSNFPVDRVNVGYRTMMQTYLDAVADLGDDDVAALFVGNARRLYGISGGA